MNNRIYNQKHLELIDKLIELLINSNFQKINVKISNKNFKII